MRKIGLFLTCSVIILMSVVWVEAQQQDKKKAGGGGFQFGGLLQGGGRINPYTLLTNAQVKKELEVTDEQIDKLPTEVMVAISKVLSEKQFTRFKQMDLQVRGNNAFKDEAVQKSLKMTDEQKKSIVSIIDESAKELQELRGTGKGFGKGGNEKVETIQERNQGKNLHRPHQGSTQSLARYDRRGIQIRKPGLRRRRRRRLRQEGR